MKTIVYAVILIMVAAVGGLAVWARLAPSDPAIWNAALVGDTPKPGPCVDQIKTVPKGAAAACLLQGDPTSILTTLNEIALSHNATLLAGTPQDGQITWISRSKLMGYPDYITAKAIATPEGTTLNIFSRQRFGSGDWGVNAARLKLWLSLL